MIRQTIFELFNDPIYKFIAIIALIQIAMIVLAILWLLVPLNWGWLFWLRTVATGIKPASFIRKSPTMPMKNWLLLLTPPKLLAD